MFSSTYCRWPFKVVARPYNPSNPHIKETAYSQTAHLPSTPCLGIAYRIEELSMSRMKLGRQLRPARALTWSVPSPGYASKATQSAPRASSVSRCRLPDRSSEILRRADAAVEYSFPKEPCFVQPKALSHSNFPFERLSSFWLLLSGDMTGAEERSSVSCRNGSSNVIPRQGSPSGLLPLSGYPFVGLSIEYFPDEPSKRIHERVIVVISISTQKPTGLFTKKVISTQTAFASEPCK